jgi:hypothetical protein
VGALVAALAADPVRLGTPRGRLCARPARGHPRPPDYESPVVTRSNHTRRSSERAIR